MWNAPYEAGLSRWRSAPPSWCICEVIRLGSSVSIEVVSMGMGMGMGRYILDIGWGVGCVLWGFVWELGFGWVIGCEVCIGVVWCMVLRVAWGPGVQMPGVYILLCKNIHID
jgi:hypothetical protein